MTDEHRAGYALALQIGARHTAALIRAGKASVGYAVICLYKEVGARIATRALFEAQNPRWALCAIRYVPDLQKKHRFALSLVLTVSEITFAGWVLANMRFLDDKERKVLEWVCSLKK